jgi:hypothetical protein
MVVVVLIEETQRNGMRRGAKRDLCYQDVEGAAEFPFAAGRPGSLDADYRGKTGGNLKNFLNSRSNCVNF